MSSKDPSQDPTLDIFAEVRRVFEERIPFNQELGLHIGEIGLDRATVHFEHRERLIGNYLRGSLHGGVISAVLDTVGGLIAFPNVLQRVDASDRDAVRERLGKIGTIDLRVDYLRSGVGKSFVATGTILRTGNKVAVARMELHNDKGTLIAVGTGTYLVG